MRNFADAAFSPEAIESMTVALDQALATLPEPISSVHVNLLAEAILRTAREGEQDPLVLQRLALLELQIAPRG
jgi:predicted component of type VI protein secretion system